MTTGQFADLVRSKLPYTPNNQQDALVGVLARFCAGLKTDSQALPLMADADRAFVINGYAGTGKTSLVSALVKALRQLHINVVLMAPTGRAAKVFSGYSGYGASTIHRRIYRHSIAGEVPGLKENKDNDTLYIVDEASMIGDAGAGGYGGTDLLTDLFTYVFAGRNNRLILMGDTAQLPPVGLPESPAMETERLRSMGLKVSHATLTRVVRQDARSGILANAVNIRRQMQENPTRIPSPITAGCNDVLTVTSEDLAEAIDTAYRTAGMDDTIIITRSNRRAAEFNKAIRSQVLYYEEELVRDEPLMIVKNNYYWTRVARRKDMDFIANGDIMRVRRIIGTEVRHGFRFADVELEPVDSSGNEESEIAPVQAKIFLETLASDQASLGVERTRALHDALLARDYPDCANPAAALANDPYWNALQAKYAYCVTCHKAQGGQWSHAMVDIAYINPEAVGPDLYRWMYTAVTRARKVLTFITDNR